MSGMELQAAIAEKVLYSVLHWLRVSASCRLFESKVTEVPWWLFAWP